MLEHYPALKIYDSYTLLLYRIKSLDLTMHNVGDLVNISVYELVKDQHLVQYSSDQLKSLSIDIKH